MPLHRHLKIFIASCLLLLFATAARPATTNAPQHYVFAHYMVCYAEYGQSLQGYQQEIQAAQTAGIDGFALDVGEWNGPDWYYKTNVELMYEAAESLNTGFKLFFSVDMGATNDIVQMVSAYANRTNSFHYNNRLVISSFLLNAMNWTNGVFQPLQAMGISNIFFVPFFNTEAGFTWQTIGAGAGALLVKYPFLNGLFNFAAGVPTDVTNLDSGYGQACKSAGKLFMAGCSPTYWGFAQPTSGRPYFESQGGEGIALEWNWIIQNQPDWVEIVTWNDINESTYINPLPTPDQFYPSPTKRYSHAGYLELTKRYISWYKTGQQLPITQDSLFYFYRTHSTNCIASNTNDVPVTAFLGNVQDDLYTTVLLTAPANLEIISGKTSTTNSLPAGTTNLRTPFATGPQQFTLRRAGVPLLSVQGPNVLSQITNNDYFTASGYAYGSSQMGPPTNLNATSGK